MVTVLNYVCAFWTIVVMNCIKPANWEYCYRIDTWLIPDLIHAWEIKTGKVVPYQIEKEYLRGIDSEIP